MSANDEETLGSYTAVLDLQTLQESVVSTEIEKYGFAMSDAFL